MEERVGGGGGREEVCFTQHQAEEGGGRESNAVVGNSSMISRLLEQSLKKSLSTPFVPKLNLHNSATDAQHDTSRNQSKL